MKIIKSLWIVAAVVAFVCIIKSENALWRKSLLYPLMTLDDERINRKKSSIFLLGGNTLIALNLLCFGKTTLLNLHIDFVYDLESFQLAALVFPPCCGCG